MGPRAFYKYEGDLKAAFFRGPSMKSTVHPLPSANAITPQPACDNVLTEPELQVKLHVSSPQFLWLILIKCCNVDFVSLSFWNNFRRFLFSL
jgi:hypothetical protein